MKLIKPYLLTSLMVIFTVMTVFNPLSVHSQGCPFNIENCRGGCGRWIDVDGDGICDLSARLKETKTDSVIIETIDNGSNQTTNNNSDSQNKIKEHNNASSKVVKKESDSEANTTIDNSTQNIDIETNVIANEADISEIKPKVAPRYNFILYSALSFGFYFLSLLLLQLKVYSLKIHRRIWNILLLITFLVSGILGLVLVIQINYGVMMKHFLQFMQWHVDFGIGMAWISIFHIIWHIKYFKAIFTPSKVVNSKQ
jgi:hypothetical protein